MIDSAKADLAVLEPVLKEKSAATEILLKQVKKMLQHQCRSSFLRELWSTEIEKRTQLPGDLQVEKDKQEASKVESIVSEEAAEVSCQNKFVCSFRA